MGKSRLYKLLSRIVNIKPGEETLVLLLFFCFFLITAPHTIIRALRYADLLHKKGSSGLPIAYLCAAVVAGLVVLIHLKIRARVSSQLLMTSSLVFFVLSGVLFHALLQTDFGTESSLLSYVYWVWGVVLVTVLVTQFWLIINEVFNPREAKRLIGFCGSGGILGGVFGGLLAKFLTDMGEPNLLLPLACVLLLLCALVVRAIYSIRKKKPLFEKKSGEAPKIAEPQIVGLKDSFNAVRKNKYLVLIASIVIVTVIISTFIDFHFSSVVDENFLNKEAKQAFFGLFFSCLFTLAFFLNIFFTGYSLKNFHIPLTLLLTPIALIIGSVAVIVAPFALIPALAIKGIDDGLGFSLQQSVRESLYIPVSSELKLKTKPFIDIFVRRFATVIASILLLIFALSLEKEVDYLTPVHDPGLGKNLLWGVIVFLILSIILSLKIPKRYINIIRNNFNPIRPSGDKIVSENLDVDYARLVFDTIESKDQSSVLFSLHLFDLLEQDKLTPEIKAMISQKADEMKASSFVDLFSLEGATWFPEIDNDVSQKAFITDIREIMSSEIYQRLIEHYVDQVMEEGGESEIEKMEMAKAIGLMDPKAPIVKKLKALINDKSVEVSRYAIQSAARLKREEFIPAIIHKLSNPLIHEDAINALKIYDNRALKLLQKYLKDSSKPIEIRKDVTKVLAQIKTQESVQILLDELNRGTEELDTEIIDALDRIRTEKADIHFPPKLVRRKILLVIKKYCQVYIDLKSLGSDEQNTKQGRQLQKRLTVDFSNIFKLLGLYYPHEDIVKAYQNLQTGSKDSGANAIEFLDNALNKKMKNAVLPLVEDLAPAERLRKFQKILRNLK
jgi:AAA family ATP:ADP antiporter